MRGKSLQIDYAATMAFKIISYKDTPRCENNAMAGRIGVSVHPLHTSQLIFLNRQKQDLRNQVSSHELGDTDDELPSFLQLTLKYYFTPPIAKTPFKRNTMKSINSS
jgi:hypothetical protein